MTHHSRKDAKPTTSCCRIIGGLAFVGLFLLYACATNEDTQKMNQSDFPPAPTAPIKPKVFKNFGIERIDNYYWLKDKTDKAVINYLNAENAYTQRVMASAKGLQNRIYKEIISRMKEDDESYPIFNNGYYYYTRTEKGKQYKTYCRKKESLNNAEEIIFDLNKMAEDQQAFIFDGFIVSPDNKKAAYLYNETGSYAEFTLKIRNLESGNDIGFSYDGAVSAEWANDNETLFYSVLDDTLRPSKIFRQRINEKKSHFIYEENDTQFFSYVDKSKTGDYIYILSSSPTTSEVRFIHADTPTEDFKVFRAREQDTFYSVDAHKNNFFIYYKDRENLNGKLYSCPFDAYSNKAAWKEERAHDKDVLIENVDVFDSYLVFEVRKNGLIEIEIDPLNGGKKTKIMFPEPVYTVGLAENPEYNTKKIRYYYSSLNRPSGLFDYDMEKEAAKLLKQQEIPSGFDPDNYTVERLWATATDGVKVPMAAVYKKGLKKDGSAPCLLYSYGSYGESMDADFTSSVYSLVDRGFVYIIAQIRGGSELGEHWYEDGKLLHKKNTFTDFIACAEHVIAQKYTSPENLSIKGGSAGGLLMGAVINMRPDLFHSVIAAVPFVDVVTSMLDDSLPLTTGEYEEWGNPNQEEYFNYMLSYSPYDNIAKQNYPHILVTGGLNDSQVLFHEPAKYTAKLRTHKTGDNLLLLHMNMESGHGGATGRYAQIEDIAFEYAFILTMLGIK